MLLFGRHSLAFVFLGAAVPGAIAACGGSVRDDAPPAPTLAVDAGAHPRPDAAPPDAGPPPPPPTDFDTTIVADEPGAEVQLAVSAKTGRIVVAWIGFASAQKAEIRWSLSDDGGRTWSAARSIGETVGDPVVAALDDGSFLLGGLRADCPSIDQCQNGEIFLARLPAGATTTGPLPSIFEGTDKAFIDHPWASVHGGDVSIIGGVFPIVNGTYQTGMSAWRSTDHGATWARSEIVTANAAAQIGIPRFCAGDGAHLWAHFYDGDSPTEGTLRFTDSADDGWTATNTTPIGGAQSGPVTAGACVVAGDRVYALLGTDATPSDPGGPDSVSPVYSDLQLFVSPDDGKTWSPVATIAKKGTQYLLPEISLEPDGTVDVFAYAGAEPDAPATAQMVRVDPNAKKAGDPLVVRDGLVFVNDRGSTHWLGDYNGIGWAGAPVVAFGDNSTTMTRVYFGRLKN